MKVLVTGASRGAGRAMAERLAALGHDVRGMVRRPVDADSLSQGAWKGLGAIRAHVADLTVPESLPGAVDGVDAIIHATATTVNAIARYPFNPARRRARVKAYAMAALRRKCLVVDAGLD